MVVIIEVVSFLMGVISLISWSITKINYWGFFSFVCFCVFILSVLYESGTDV